MLRVLHCIYDDPENPWVGGGGALRVYEIYRRLAGRVDVTVATGSFPGARDQLSEGVRYVRLGADRPYALSRMTYARAAARRLRHDAYDVALFDFSAYTPILIPSGRPVGVIVHMLHGPTAPRRWSSIGGLAVSQTERAMLRRARWVCTTSNWMVDQLRPLLAPEARVWRIGSGVPEEFWTVERSEASYLLYYGRFDAFQKGLDLLLTAFASIAATHPRVDLWLAGRGKDAGEIRKMAAQLNLTDRVRVWENVPRTTVLTLLAGALMLVLPSRLEGLPMVPAEAMAAGVPVIASAVGAVAEVVDPPRGGLLVPPDDGAALADAIASLLHDPERRQAISRAAKVSAERFTWERVAEEHLGFLEEVAASARDFPHTDHRLR